MGARPAPHLSTAKRRSPQTPLVDSHAISILPAAVYPIFIDGAGQILANAGTLLPLADALWPYLSSGLRLKDDRRQAAVGESESLAAELLPSDFLLSNVRLYGNERR
jgi:hypothetical protein